MSNYWVLIVCVKNFVKFILKNLLKLVRKAILIVDKLPEPEYKVTKLLEVIEIKRKSFNS